MLRNRPTKGWEPTDREADETVSRVEAQLLPVLLDRIEQLRPAHPVSILDLSPEDGVASAIARSLRGLPRKFRLMTYQWAAVKVPERTAGFSEILVERGRLPGLHFSDGSFDYLIGADVLWRLGPLQRVRAVAEMHRVALRGVALLEREGVREGLGDAEVRDVLLQGGLPAAVVDRQRGSLRLLF